MTIKKILQTLSLITILGLTGCGDEESASTSSVTTETSITSEQIDACCECLGEAYTSWGEWCLGELGYSQCSPALAAGYVVTVESSSCVTQSCAYSCGFLSCDSWDCRI
jgi:hypothetical protein